MRRDARLVKALAAVAILASLLLVAFAALAVAMIGSSLEPQVRAHWLAPLSANWPLLLLLVLASGAVAGALAQPVLRAWMLPPQRLSEQVQAVVASPAAQKLRPGAASGALQALAHSIDALAAQRDRLREEQASEVARSSAGIARERNRLAALMSELSQSVVVCNLDGLILLYNPRARMQFRALSDAPGLTQGAELIGLGRSIYAVFDRALVGHALDSVRQRLARGVAHPSAQFVTVTRQGQLLRVQVAPVRDVAAPDEAQAGALPVFDGDPGQGLSGFVLMLDNITREHEQDAELQQRLGQLGEAARAALAGVQVGLRALPAAGSSGEGRADSQGEPQALNLQTLALKASEALERLIAHTTQGLATRWPLEPMRGADFLQAARQRIAAAAGLRTGLLDVDERLWLKVDSFALLRALAYLAVRLHEEFDIQAVHLRLQPGSARQAHLDLVWSGQAMSTETVMSWELDAMDQPGGGVAAQSVREVVQQHGGAFWFERDRVRHQAFFRLALPRMPDAAAAEAAAPPPPMDARPEFFDFDLFAITESSYSMDERPLAELAYTVFDTETTGLQPAGGDEIIQLGATRVLNGKVLRAERFDQLVDPQRSIPAAGIPIHGITPQMVSGQPTIDQVLPAFHAFARDSVLVAHNAAFDMRFLQLKEARTGLRFDQPVLDTLLLSAVVHPHQESHRLEAIAERFGIEVVGRHTALGDALVTAEVLLRLIPLLAAQGIHTLGQAREAAQKTYYARIKY